MLNQAVKINMNTPATGIIQKSSEKSFFRRFHQNSSASDNYFSDEPTYSGRRIVVLQVMLMNDGLVLAEVMFDESGE